MLPTKTDVTDLNPGPGLRSLSKVLILIMITSVPGVKVSDNQRPVFGHMTI